MSSPAADLSERLALQVLCALPGVGPVTARRLLDAFQGDPRAVLDGDTLRLQRVEGVGPATLKSFQNWPQRVDPAKLEARMAQTGVTFALEDEDGYPPLLRRIYDPPLGLYRQGPAIPAEKTVAFVGTRAATRYGLRVAREFAAGLASRGYCIVSGLARGIDAAAHEGALEANGITAAVLGCGIDVIYPPEHLDLYRQIAETGAIYSEFTLGRAADRNTFPMRNRLISGMSRALLVVETGLRGGSLITARAAADQNRDVFAIPGRIDQPTSEGCHALIREGATLVTSVNELLEELEGAGPQIDLPLDAPRQLPDDLTDDERAVMAAFSGGATLSPDGLADASQLPPSTVAAVLMLLEIKQLVAKLPDGRFEALL